MLLIRQLSPLYGNFQHACGFFDRSESTTNVSNLYDTYNLGVSDSEGAILNLGGTVVATDAGAIAAGRDVAVEALLVGERNLDHVTNFGLDVLDAGSRQNDRVAQVLSDAATEQFRASADVTRDALGFGERVTTGSIDAVVASSRDSLDAVRDSQSAGYSFAGDALDRSLSLTERTTGDALELGRGFLEESSHLVDRVLTQVNNTGASFLSAVEQFQSRESNNTDARLQDITRTGLIGVFALGAVGVLAYAYVARK